MPRSYVIYCALAWFGTIATLVVLRLTALRGIERHRPTRYVKARHPRKWHDLNYTPVLGSGTTSSFRVFGFIFSKDNLMDPVVAGLKAHLRRLTVLTIVVLVIWMPMALFFTYPWDGLRA